jgi:4-alpha-glucanotransferase
VAALDRAERAKSDSSLPSVIVARSAGQRCSFEVSLPARTRQLSWLIDLEDGTQRRGTIAPDPGPSSGPQPALREVHRIELEDIPWGYHRLHLPDFQASAELIVTPGQCWLPDGFNKGSGLWGIAAQLYLLRSDGNWGIGDFADLAKLVDMSAERGCSVIGLNPLHQMFLDNPDHASPYSPLTRLYLNVLYISVPNAPGYAESERCRALVSSPDFQSRLAACKSSKLVDYTAVTSLKLEVLQLLFKSFGDPADRERFEAFRSERGRSLRRSSIFQALRQRFTADDPQSADWHSWPDEYRDANSSAVERFAEAHREQVDFYDWLQWVADEQLAAAARAAGEAGMAIGLYRDLAVGCDRSGAETWSNPDAFLSGAEVGAPPDIFNPAGQNWGLPPFHPNALRDNAYRPFIELIRANMRHAGGLRIDHVMGLQHLYCIPEGCSPAEGAYVAYPLSDLVGILALESQRHRCLVVGEDLGTVPEGFRETMAEANILSYRVLFFEQDWEAGSFLPPENYPRKSLAVAGSHDLPTLIGWWEGRDIDLKERLGLYPSQDEAESQRQRREQDRQAILQALREQGLIDAAEPSADQFAVAAHEFLAQSNAALVVPQLDDLLGEVEQVNVPATTLENPNWRRKYRATLEEISSGDETWQLAGRLPELRK